MRPVTTQNQLVPCLQTISRFSGGDRSLLILGQRTKGHPPCVADTTRSHRASLSVTCTRRAIGSVALRCDASEARIVSTPFVASLHSSTQPLAEVLRFSAFVLADAQPNPALTRTRSSSTQPTQHGQPGVEKTNYPSNALTKVLKLGFARCLGCKPGFACFLARKSWIRTLFGL